MALSTLIIDIRKDLVVAGVFSTRKKEALFFHVEKVSHTGLMPDRADVKDALKKTMDALNASGCARFDEAICGVPLEEMHLKTLKLPFDEREKLLGVLPFELEGAFPIDMDEAAIDAMMLSRSNALALAIEKKVLKEYLGLFEECGIDPARVCPSILAIPALLGGENVKLFASRDSLAVVEEGKLLFVNTLSGAGSLRLSLAYLEKEGVLVDEVFTSDCGPGVFEEIKKLLPHARMESIGLPAPLTDEGSGVFALWSESWKGNKGGLVNFRKDEFGRVKDRLAAKRKMALAGALAVMAAMLFAGDAYIRYSGYAKEAAHYKNVLGSSYNRLFPDERTANDELYRLEAKLKAMENEAALLSENESPLEVLNRISSVPGTRNIKISEITISGKRISAKGEAASIEGANSFKDALASGAFESVSLVEAKPEAGGKIAFTLSIKAAGGKDA